MMLNSDSTGLKLDTGICALPKADGTFSVAADVSECNS